MMHIDTAQTNLNHTFGALSFEGLIPPRDCPQYQYVLTREQLATCADLEDVFKLVSKETGVSVDDLKRMNEGLIKAWDLGTLTDASQCGFANRQAGPGLRAGNTTSTLAPMQKMTIDPRHRVA